MPPKDPKTERTARGRRSREYGHDHERWVAQQYRKKWPQATVRRSLQAHSAAEPDVVVEGDVPYPIGALWSECCTGASVNPLKKLTQAENDSCDRDDWLPVVVWRDKGSRAVKATMRHGTLLALTGASITRPMDDVWCLPITMDFVDLLEILP